MRKMKDSGIEWIGEIPSDWDVLKLKQLCSMPITDGTHKTPEYADESDGVPFLSSKDVTSGKIDWTNIKHITKDLHKILHKEIAVKRNDVLLAKNGTTGIAALVDCDTVFDIYVTLAVLRPNQKIVLPNYLIYIVNSAVSKIQFDEHLIGIGVPNLHLNVINGVKALVPPIDEQQRIANFLDEKCGEIDSIRSDIQKQIDILNDYKKSVITEAVTKGLNPKAKLKDSGIEWIGKIPEGWDVIRLKHASWLKGRIGWQGLRSEEFIDEGPYLITGTDFKDGHINWETCVHISEQRFNQDKAIQIKEDDLLITKDGTIGKLAVVKNCPEKVSLNSGVFIIRNNGKYKYNDKYMYYVLQSEEFSLWFDLSNSGNSTIKHLNQESFYNFAFAYPPLPEQKAIADYLDEKCSEINATIADKQRQLETLDEYKKSLIFEYVTGKKEVS